MLLLFFSILACNTSNTYWLIYSRSQHLTRLANDFPVFLLNRSKLLMCSYYFFLFWPVTLPPLHCSSTVLFITSPLSPLTFSTLVPPRSTIHVSSLCLC